MMIRVNLRQYFIDRIWFGWWYRGVKVKDSPSIFGWVRDPLVVYRWKVMKIDEAVY